MKKSLVVFFMSAMILPCFAQDFNNPHQWSTYTDSGNGGSSTVVMTAKNEDISGDKVFAVSISGVVTTQYQYGFAGLILTPTKGQLKSIQSDSGVKFMVIGDGQVYRFRAETSDVKDFDFYGYVVHTTAGVPIQITIPYSDLKQDSWGKAVSFDPHHIKQLSFQTMGQPLPSYSLKIYNFQLLP
ncbi:MAG: hypothetical protein HKM05_03890 [Spirochaetales bacterium]|nr:hypothetical protein [Spirochaetales bacterium]